MPIHGYDNADDEHRPSDAYNPPYKFAHPTHLRRMTITARARQSRASTIDFARNRSVDFLQPYSRTFAILIYEDYAGGF